MKLEFTFWFVLFEFIFASIFEIFVFFVFGYLVWLAIKNHWQNNHHTLDASPAMLLYMIIEVFTAFFVAFFLIYLLQGWNSGDNHYNGYILFYSGATQTFMMTLRPVTVFSLGLDRCCCVLFPFKYRGKAKIIPIFVAIILMVLSVAHSVAPRIIEFAPKTAETNCAAFGCMTNPASDSLYITMRYVSSAVNLAMGILLFIILRIRVKQLTLKVSLNFSNFDKVLTIL